MKETHVVDGFSISVDPGVVILKAYEEEIPVPMETFKSMARWYLEEQNKENHEKTKLWTEFGH